MRVKSNYEDYLLLGQVFVAIQSWKSCIYAQAF